VRMIIYNVNVLIIHAKELKRTKESSFLCNYTKTMDDKLNFETIKQKNNIIFNFHPFLVP